MIPAGWQETYKKHERWVPVAFFVLGFAFDAVMLKRIDEPMVLIQQALYIALSATFIGLELIEVTREVAPPRWLAKVWRFREALLHFMLGTLLNCYTIFYFKSASAFTSFAFIAVLVGLLMVNEFKHFGKSQSRVHIAFLSLCLVSYLVALVPILLGSLGLLAFLASIAATVLVFGAYYRFMRGKLAAEPSLLRTHLLMPFGGILGIFCLLYFARVIPPVPLSVSYMGIFHEVKKSEGEYELAYDRPAWKFWQHGDQTFRARPGDSIYCFARIFSPSRFNDHLHVRWFYYDERLGWEPSDAIPIAIQGGREEGYRTVTMKKNYQPGEWRVQIETQDNREIGRIGFTVEPDANTGERVYSTIRQ